MKRVSLRRVLDVLGGLVFALLVLVPSVTGLGALPALGGALNPGTGVWRISADAGTAQSGDLTLPGLKQPATVSFEDNGLAHVKTGDDADLFRVVGYLHARFRLVQMDLTRRQASGTLSEVIGAATLEVDRFERDLGLRRAAERDWAALKDDNPAKTTLQAYSDGVNAAMRELRSDNRMPTQFAVLGYEP
ncbi:MAG TPA: penicillin acylase family protein, partial [Lentzea sp.]